MNSHQKNEHQFALFYKEFSHICKHRNTTIRIDDPELIHRIVNVLRLTRGTRCILFDRLQHAICTIESFDKKSIIVTINACFVNDIYKPYITIVVPLLKRDALQEAIYSCTELGANSIHLVETHKQHQSWQGQKELQRLERIMIAAAEQSKNFAYPDLHGPIGLKDLLDTLHNDDLKIFFDADGISLHSLNLEISDQHIICMSGPEGDLTPNEKQLLKQHQFKFCRLAPTILRTQQAIAVGLGCMRAKLGTCHDEHVKAD